MLFKRKAPPPPDEAPPITMTSISDSGNETRESSESDNSPTPTKDLHQKPPSRTGLKDKERPAINTRTTPVSRTTPVVYSSRTSQSSGGRSGPPSSLRLTPVVTRGPPRQAVRPPARRPPSSGGTSTASSVGGAGVTMAPLTSSRGRQRNSVAVVDSRDHIYEELDMYRGPPNIAPISGVLPQGKVVIRPIAFKPVVSAGAESSIAHQSLAPPLSGSTAGAAAGTGTPVAPLDPRYTSTPSLSRGPVHHYGSMGDLKTMGSASYSLDRRGCAMTPYSRAPYYEGHSTKTAYLNSRNMSSNSVHNSSLSSRTPPPLRQSTNTSYETGGSAGDSRGHPSYEDRTQPLEKYSTIDIQRFESLRNLSNDPSAHHPPHPSLHRLGGSVSNLSRISHAHSSSVQALDRSNSNAALDRASSVTCSNLLLERPLNTSNLVLDQSGSNLGLDRTGLGYPSGSLSELTLDDHHQTPSPSDSGVAELEAQLKEKDTEINTLRETMEQNEQVIFKVYEEKEKTWERELKKIRDLYDSRLRGAHQKALKIEQSLRAQLYELQQEKRRMSAELDETRRSRTSSQDEAEQLRREVTSLGQQLEEIEWTLCQKTGEISLLKSQLKDSQGDQTTRGHELLHLRAQVRQYQQEIERRRAETVSLHDLTAQLRRETADLRSQQEKGGHHRKGLEELRLENEVQKKKFEEERARWREEKDRVLKYQKQLQQSYLATMRRNRQLEDEVARLGGGRALPSAGDSSGVHDLREAGLQPSGESRC